MGDFELASPFYVAFRMPLMHARAAAVVLLAVAPAWALGGH